MLGGATLSFDVHPGHPHEKAVYGLLRRVRGEVNALWNAVTEYNRAHPLAEGEPTARVLLFRADGRERRRRREVGLDGGSEMSTRQTKGTRAGACIASLALLLLAASGCSKSRQATNGNTNWLHACTESVQCGEGAQCVCGVCTRECEATAECGGELAGTSCQDTSSQALSESCTGGSAGVERACLAPCQGDDECRGIRDGASCEGSVCVLADADSAAAGGPTAGSGTTTTHDAPFGPLPEDAIVVEGPRRCGGALCGANEICCYTTGACFDAADRAACPTPSAEDVAEVPAEGAPCASNADCAQDEACTGALHCEGAGSCMSRTNCGTSWGGPEMCGCDGLDYPNVQSACYNGARIATPGAACGVSHEVGAGGSFASGLVVTGCGSDDDCAGGDSCCALTGRCYDPALPALCTEPPDGTDQSCLDDSHCLPGSYCKRDGCEGPGGCASPGGASECGIELEPVCGCNGVTYTSARCAAAAGVNVRQAGECAE